MELTIRKAACVDHTGKFIYAVYQEGSNNPILIYEKASDMPEALRQLMTKKGYIDCRLSTQQARELGLFKLLYTNDPICGHPCSQEKVCVGEKCKLMKTDSPKNCKFFNTTDIAKLCPASYTICALLGLKDDEPFQIISKSFGPIEFRVSSNGVTNGNHEHISVFDIMLKMILMTDDTKIETRPRFTEEERADAKMIKRMHPLACGIKRVRPTVDWDATTLLVTTEDGLTLVKIHNTDLFPSIHFKSNDNTSLEILYTIDEILGR